MLLHNLLIWFILLGSSPINYPARNSLSSKMAIHFLGCSRRQSRPPHRFEAELAIFTSDYLCPRAWALTMDMLE